MGSRAIGLTAPPAGGAPFVLWAGLAAAAGYVFALAWAMEHTPYDVWGALLLAPFLVAVGVPVIVAVTRHDEQPLTGLIVVALLAKLAGAIVRYSASIIFYGGLTDPARYDRAGKAVADAFRDGQLAPWQLLPTSRGTAFIEELTGLLYSLVGPTRIGGFLAYSFLGFWGLFLFHRAARIGFPEADQRRYALFVFFLPSLVFWPSSIGKDAWMLASLGVAAYGAARLLTGRRFGLTVAVVGAAGTAMVRPHLTVLLGAALLVAVLVRRRRAALPLFGPVVNLVLVGVLAVGFSLAVSVATDYLGIRPAEGESQVEAILDETARRTEQGGSQIEVQRPNRPLEYPQAAFTVLFRPTLFEVRSTTVLLSALESTLLLVVFVLSWRRLIQTPRHLFRRPYLLFALSYAAAFVFAWSAVGNLGIIARQRVQVLPFVLLLLAVPLAGGRRDVAEPAPARAGA